MLHGDLLGERARLTPSKLALVDVATGARLTYAELDARASRCAALLRRHLGLAKGDRFGILASNSLEYLDFFFAAGKSGAAIVPLGTRLTAHELSPIICDSGLRVLIYDESFGETVRVLRDQVSLDHWMSL